MTNETIERDVNVIKQHIRHATKKTQYRGEALVYIAMQRLTDAAYKATFEPQRRGSLRQAIDMIEEAEKTLSLAKVALHSGEAAS